MQQNTQMACLVVPSLPLACAALERPTLRARTVALSDESGLRVAGATAAARAQGIRDGMTIREAVALCPSLDVVESRPADVSRVAASLVAAMHQVSPIVEEAAPGIVFADLRGTERLFSMAEVERLVFGGVDPALGARLGIAGGRFTAYAAARSARAGTLLCIAAVDAAAFLAPLPVDWLPLDRAAVERLRLLGLNTCGDLAALPLHAVEAHFGPPGGAASLAARGEDPTPIRARPHEAERVVERLQADPPLASREAILHALEQMLGRALRHPRARHRFVRAGRSLGARAGAA